MTLIEPLNRQDASEFKDLMEFYEGRGYFPNNLLTLARVPGLLQALHNLHSTAMVEHSRVTPELKVLLAHVSSGVAGCRYCQAHTAFGAEKRHGNAERIDEIWEFRTSVLFTDAERAAIELAAGAGVTPNAVTDDMRKEARKYWTDDELAEIVAIISVMGFMNRWNDTVAIPLEAPPMEYAKKRLQDHGWEPGRHG